MKVVALQSIANKHIRLGVSDDGKVVLHKHPDEKDPFLDTQRWILCVDGTIRNPKNMFMDVCDKQQVVHRYKAHLQMWSKQTTSINQLFYFYTEQNGNLQIIPMVNQTVALDIYDTRQPKLHYWLHKPENINQQWKIIDLDSHEKSVTPQNQIKSKVEKSKSQETILSKMNMLSSVYDKGYEFPGWSINYTVDDYEQMRSVKTYFDGEDNISLVKSLMMYREPANIASVKLFDEKKMKDTFGWDTGFYNSYYEETGSLAPNIAVYTHAYVEKMKTRVHIINSIGYAFDSKEQTDYKYFLRGDVDVSNLCDVMIKRYTSVFKKIYKCASDHGLKTIVFSIVGGNNFAKHYRDNNGSGVDYFQTHVWVPAYLKAQKTNKNNFHTVFMGGEGSVAFEMLKQINPALTDIGLFPSNLTQVNPSKTLFVNAWDPVSVPGNGNSKDASLDGYIGRATNIAVLGTAMTNPYMQQDKNIVAVL
jgi:hypothetical protein